MTDRNATATPLLHPFRIFVLALGGAAWSYWFQSAAAHEPHNLLVIRWATALVLLPLAFVHRPRLRPPDGVTAVGAVIVGAALLPRLIRLETAPYDVTFDEAIHPVFGLDILRSEPWSVFDGASGYFQTPYLDFATQGFLCLFFDPLLGGRLASVLMSMVSLVSTYALASRLFDRVTGLFATIVLACSYWHIAYARMAHPYMQAIMIVTLALWVLMYALDEDSAFFAFVGGVLLGVATLLYTSARVVVPVFGLWWLYGAVTRRFRWRTLLPIALGAVVFLSPYLRAHGPRGFIDRYHATATSSTAPLTVLGEEGWFTGDALVFAAGLVVNSLRIYVRPGAWLAPHDFSPAPMIDAVTAVIALAGLILCAQWWHRSACLLLLLWVGGTFFGGQVLTDVPQAAYRAGPLLPALAIVAGLTLARLAHLASWRFSVRSAAAQVGLGIATVAVLLPLNLQALDRFFAQRRTEVTTDIARVVAAESRLAPYHLVGFGPLSDDPRVRLVVGDRAVSDVSSLSDLLNEGFPAEPTRPGRDVVLVLHADLQAAESAIRRCYPAAIRYTVNRTPGHAAVGLLIPPLAVASGQECRLQADGGRGLRARYYQKASFKGDIVLERLEDWPMRWLDYRSTREFGSVEWRGFLTIPTAGGYIFHLADSSGNLSASIGDVSMKAGETTWAPLEARSYPITLRMSAGAGAVYWLSWTPPDGGAQSIPPELFSPESPDGD